LFVIEIKFSKHRVGVDVIGAVKEKVRRISLPRGFAILPVLIHVNGVTDNVMDAEYFHAIIDFGALLERY